MIRFDSNSIYNRIVDKLQQDPDWKVIINNSVVASLIKSNAEANAETARYAEYLFKESRWDTAQNPSSILSMANMLGYQPKRKISARGKLYVSLSPATHLVGKTISYDAFLKLDKKIVTTTTSQFVRNAGAPISINSSSTVTCGDKNFIVTNASTLDSDSYITSVDIMEGVKKTQLIDFNTILNTATTSKLDPYLYIPITINNCEDASNLSSIPFLNVYVGYKGQPDIDGNEQIRYRQYRIVENLLLSNPGDYDCELYNDLYNQNLFYLKFNNDLYNGNCLDLSRNSSIEHIRIDYVESKGENGNIDDLYSDFRLETTASNGSKITLYGINYTAINGGANEESINDIKRNTIKSYTKYFSIGTKEAYEKAISNTEFTVDEIGLIKPKKVHVYGDYYVNDKGDKQMVTYVSFIGSGLEDLSYNSTKANPYESVEKALNYYLTRLKSPQDIIKFTPPEYVSFSVGIDCTVSNTTEYELVALQSSIADYVDSLWGPNSDYIDFGNNFSASKLQNNIMTKYTDVTANVTVEAVTKLKWSDAVIITPKTDENGVIHTCRIPFSFSPVFLGDMSTNPGFKDHRDGAQYVMRIDIMYKKPKSYAGIDTEYHKSIFVKEDRNRAMDRTGFYTIQTLSPIVWADDTSSDTIAINSTDYTELGDVDKLNVCYQVDYEPKVFSDSDFIALENEIKLGVKTTRTASLSPGALDNYIIYFSGSYNQNSAKIGNGWIEFTFDDFYKVLTYFSLYDSILRDRLNTCQLHALKCGVSNDAVFNIFKDLISGYVDIYVSMRPIKEDLTLTTLSDLNKYGANRSNEVLYIDSYDTQIFDNMNNANNLTLDKKARFINVKCSYEDV